MVSLPAFGRVCQRAVLLVASLDVCQQRSLCFRIGNTELVSTLEHQVLQIVCQTSSLGRVVLRTGTHDDECLDAGFLIIDTEIDLQSVLQRIDTRLQRIAIDRLVFILTATCQQQHADEHYWQP